MYNMYICSTVSYVHIILIRRFNFIFSLQPVAPPAAGKVFDRCTFCNCCITYPATAKKMTCARPTWLASTCCFTHFPTSICPPFHLKFVSIIIVSSPLCSKKVLFYHTTTGRLVKRWPCEVCHYEMENCDDPGSNISVLICSQCGESNVGSREMFCWQYNMCAYSRVITCYAGEMLLYNIMLSPYIVVCAFPPSLPPISVHQVCSTWQTLHKVPLLQCAHQS